MGLRLKLLHLLKLHLKKNEEGVVVNKFKPKNPYFGQCPLNTSITETTALA